MNSRPQALQVIPDTIPTELKNINAWVVWQYRPSKDGKWTKVPYQLDGLTHASSTDPATWGTFGEALKRYESGGCDGVGFVLHDGCGYVGIDLDHCRNDGKIDLQALKIIEEVNSYTEISPSGTGVRIFVKGKLPPGGRKKGNIEIYDIGRYLTVTGCHLTSTPITIELRQEAIEALHERVFETSKDNQTNRSPYSEQRLELHDDVLLERAFSANNGPKVKRLYDGDISGYTSPSEADLALCSCLAFWTQDPTQLDRLFRASKLFREKWDEKHYADGSTIGQKTIQKALAGNKEHYGDTTNDSKGVNDPIAGSTAPLDNLSKDTPPLKIEDALRSVALSLNGSDSLRRATIREATIKKLEKVGVSSPARMVDAAFQDEHSATSGQQQGRPVMFDDPEPWPDPVDGDVILAETESQIKRFVIVTDEQALAIALWVFHAHALDAADVSPPLTFKSPVPECGKTTAEAVVGRLTPLSILTSNISPAAMFRLIDKYCPTLLIDEGDTFVKLSEDMRGILNASHFRNSAFVVRAVGDDFEPKQFSTWCPKVIALIGDLPPTLTSRSILIPMKRKRGNQTTERFSPKEAYPDLQILRRKIARWSTDSLPTLKKLPLEIPTELGNNRARDNWIPLLVIAGAIGGKWPHRARAAAIGLSGVEVEEPLNVELLRDVRDLFYPSVTSDDPSILDDGKVFSKTLTESLVNLAERPWASLSKGRPMSQNTLARFLREFGIKSLDIRIDDRVNKGFRAEWFNDIFSRYLDSEDFKPQQGQQSNEFKKVGDIYKPQQRGDVADGKTGVSTGTITDVAGVADRNPLAAEDGGWEEP